MTSHISRRDFLLFVTGTAGAALFASCRPADEAPEGVPTLVAAGFDPTAPPSPPAPTGAESFKPPDPAHSAITFDDGIRLTPLQEFYVQSSGLLGPPVDRDRWSLTIDGLVERPVTLRYDDLLAYEPVTVIRTLECIGNPVGGSLIGNQNWTGIRLKPLLEQAGVSPSAIRAKFEAGDGYDTAVELEWLLQEDTLLVYAMDGQPLTHDHGYPLRIMMPGLYGQKMPKWITRIELIDYAHLGYYEQDGWSDIAEVKTNSQIVLPENLATIHGSFALQGWAYAGKRRIVEVEVSVDGEPWQPCEVLPGPSPLVWTQWWTTWTPTRTGAFTAAVRATDETGFQQNRPGEFLESAFPAGTDAIHSVAYNAQPPSGS